MATPSPGPNFTLLPNGNWVPKGGPLDTTGAPKTGPGSTPSPSGGPPAAPSVPGQTAPGQATDASYYSPTAQNSPTPYTTNQGTQDVVRNSYLQQATQGTNIDMNNPVIRQQQDAFESAQERARRTATSDNAESANAQGLAGPGGSGALTAENRLVNERAMQSDAAFSAQLAANELQNRRAEIQNALSSLGGMISEDQRNALQLQLAQINEKLGYADLKLRGELGHESNAINRLGVVNQNDQFNKRLGFDIGNAQMGYNQDALLALLRG